MSRPSFFLIAFLVFNSGPAIAGLPAGVILKPLKSTVRDCQLLLEDRLGTKNLQAWDSLPGALSLLTKATVLVRLDLTGAMPRLSYANQLTGPVAGVTAPDELRVLHESTVAFVAHGDGSQLMKLYDRIAKSPAAPFASYKIVDYSSTREPLELPKSAISIDGIEDLKEVDSAINAKRGENTSFTVYVLNDARQPIFFFPRAQIEDAFDRDVLAQLRINASAIARQPSSIARWLAARAEVFDKKAILYVEDWALVSLPAFRKLYEFSRITSTRLPPVDEPFRNALADCFDLTCASLPPSNIREVPASAASASPASEMSVDMNAMNAAGRSRLIAYLKAHRGTHPLTAPYGVRHAFTEIGKLIENSDAASRFRAELRDTSFTATEYNLLYTSAAAQDRFARTWRSFLTAMENPMAGEPFTTRNIQRAISLLPD